MIEITPSIKIDDDEIQIDFIHASGPGGQNVNKVATAAQLRFDARHTPSLEPEIKERLAKLAGNRLTEEGILIILARRYRTQEGNRQDAVRRLIALIQQAAIKPEIRKPTSPGITAKAARVGDKKKRGEVKRLRRYVPDEWE
jgi:ribosome-associated protein